CRIKSKSKVLFPEPLKSMSKMSALESAPDASPPPTGAMSQPVVTNGRNVRDWLALGSIALLPFLFYWRATFGLGMFFFGDIARFFFPTRVLYAAALNAGRLPLWLPAFLTVIP